MRSLAPLQLPLNGIPDEIRPVLALGQNRLDAGEGPLGEPGLHVLGPHFLASHGIISHMSY